VERPRPDLRGLVRWGAAGLPRAALAPRAGGPDPLPLRHGPHQRPHNRLFNVRLPPGPQTRRSPPGLERAFMGQPGTQGLRTFAPIYAAWAASQALQAGPLRSPWATAAFEAYVERSWLPRLPAANDPNICWRCSDTLAGQWIWRCCAEQGQKTSAGIEAERSIWRPAGRIKRPAPPVIAGLPRPVFPADDCVPQKPALIAGAASERLGRCWGIGPESVARRRPSRPVIAPLLKNLLKNF